jgi:hypothetical protein
MALFWARVHVLAQSLFSRLASILVKHYGLRSWLKPTMEEGCHLISLVHLIDESINIGFERSILRHPNGFFLMREILTRH